MTSSMDRPVLDRDVRTNASSDASGRAGCREAWYTPGRAGRCCRGSFAFIDTAAGSDVPIRVHYALPARRHAHAPILFVLPGIDRDGAPYLRAWAPCAAQAGR